MPVNRMSRFEIFVGVWNTTGEVLETDAAPASTLVATDTYRWLPGHQFIIHDVDARFDQQPARSMEVMGYEQSSKKYFARSFDDQGVTEAFEIALVGRRWKIIGKNVRFSGGFDERRNRLSGLWELKAKRGAWQPWIKLELRRA
jgi:Protein of unknown function (DUF1579)